MVLPDLQTMSFLSGLLANFVAYGIGLACVFWLLGLAVFFVVEFLR